MACFVFVICSVTVYFPLFSRGIEKSLFPAHDNRCAHVPAGEADDGELSFLQFCYSFRQYPSQGKVMPKSVNKVILLGNVGKDPEVKFLPSGSAVANFTLATSERFKDKGGEWQDRTEWHNLTAYQRLAEIVRDYVKKGSKLYIEGRIQTRSWDDQASGQKKYRTEIIVNEMVLLSGKSEGGEGQYSRSNTSSFDQRSPGNDFAGTEITDEDIPF
jgi:single-strand DNA-binding protein